MLVLVDMDGVVSDFDKHILEIYGKPMSAMTNREKNKFWDAECVSLRFFANSPPIKEGLQFVRELEASGLSFSFLTSTGGGIQHVAIAEQKLGFLQRYGMGHLPVAFATDTKCKALFANDKTVLVDDRQKVIDAFMESGGCAHLFSRDRWKLILDALLSPQ